MSKTEKPDRQWWLDLFEGSSAGPSVLPRRRRSAAKLIGVLLLVGLLSALVVLPYVAGAGLAVDAAATRFLGQECDLSETTPPQRTTVYASDGKTVLATLFSQDREPVALSKVPPILQKALIATEDRRFYDHHGVDLRGLVRSAVMSSSGDVQGGSTLTMQYVKEERFYQASNDAEREAAIVQNIDRKIADAKCALYFEDHVTKAEILDKYLNIAFFGENAYGVQAAAQTYFGVKDVSQLAPWQSAMLVGMVKSPTEYNPYGNNGRNAVAARLRRNEVIQNLVDTGEISQSTATGWQAKPLDLAGAKAPTMQEGCSGTIGNVGIRNAGFFCDYLTDWLVNSREGPRLSDRRLREGGLKIVSTLDVTAQNRAEAALSRISATSPTTAIMPELDPRTGRILAMATSKRYGVQRGGGHTVVPIFTQNAVNGAATFGLFPLLAALSEGVDPSLQLSASLDETGKLFYSPTHCRGTVSRFYNTRTGDFTRDETLASAVAKSSATYLIALEDQVFGACELQAGVDLAVRLGISSLRERVVSDGKLRTVASRIAARQEAEFALGPYKTNPLELTAAYAAVANAGVFNTPTPVRSITGPDGRKVNLHRRPGTRVIAADVARLASALLSGQTQSPEHGVTGAQFDSWYAANPSPIVGAAGGNVAGTRTDGVTPVNSSMWFVGATPTVAATTMMMNLARPSAELAGLPDAAGARPGLQDGQYAATFWLAALGPGLDGHTWQWFDHLVRLPPVPTRPPG